MTFDLRLPLSITALLGVVVSIRFVAQPIVPIVVEGQIGADTRPQTVPACRQSETGS